MALAFRLVPLSEIIARPDLSMLPVNFIPEAAPVHHQLVDEDDVRRDDPDDIDWIDEVEGYDDDDDDDDGLEPEYEDEDDDDYDDNEDDDLDYEDDLDEDDDD